MRDTKLVADAIIGLQEEIERLKRVNKVLQERVIFLENNKPCKDCASNPISEYSNLENESQFLKERIEKIEQIVNEWNNDASHSFSDMCKINGILKE